MGSMNGLDFFIEIYKYLVLLKILANVVLSVTNLTISICFLQDSHSDNNMIYTIGSILASSISIIYVFKRLIWSKEEIYTEIFRLSPLLWAIYGSVYYTGEFSIMIGLLYTMGILNLFKMILPVDEKDIRA